MTLQKTQERASPVIVWFRQDLRLKDNPALLAAGGDVVPVYISTRQKGCERQEGQADGGSTRVCAVWTRT